MAYSLWKRETEESEMLKKMYFMLVLSIRVTYMIKQIL